MSETDVQHPWDDHQPGECDECDWNRGRINVLSDGGEDPGPYREGFVLVTELRDDGSYSWRIEDLRSTQPEETS